MPARGEERERVYFFCIHVILVTRYCKSHSASLSREALFHLSLSLYLCVSTLLFSPAARGEDSSLLSLLASSSNGHDERNNDNMREYLSIGGGESRVDVDEDRSGGGGSSGGHLLLRPRESLRGWDKRQQGSTSLRVQQLLYRA